MRVVGECFFWYRLTRVVPDNSHRAVKRLCVCVCCYYHFTALCPWLPGWANTRWNIYVFIPILYLLPPFTTIHNILPVQFTCLTIFLHNLCPNILWSTSWSGTLCFMLHIFTQLLFSFRNPWPCQCNFFCSTEIMSSNLSLSLNFLLGTLIFYLNATHPYYHSHVCLLKCLLIFFLQVRSHFHATYYFAAPRLLIKSNINSSFPIGKAGNHRSIEEYTVVEVDKHSLASTNTSDTVEKQEQFRRGR